MVYDLTETLRTNVLPYLKFLNKVVLDLMYFPDKCTYKITVMNPYNVQYKL